MSDINFLYPSKHNAQVEQLEERCRLLLEENHIMRYVLGRCVIECQGDIARLANEALNYKAKHENTES